MLLNAGSSICIGSIAVQNIFGRCRTILEHTYMASCRYQSVTVPRHTTVIMMLLLSEMLNQIVHFYKFKGAGRGLSGV